MLGLILDICEKPNLLLTSECGRYALVVQIQIAAFVI